jgi:hypothetical protein
MRGPGESYCDVIIRLAAVGRAVTERVLTRKRRLVVYSSLSDRVMVWTAWIDWPVDTQGCALCFHVISGAAWKRTMLNRPRPVDLATSASAP